MRNGYSTKVKQAENQRQKTLSADELQARLRIAAIELLSRREHSQKELHDKLLKRFKHYFDDEAGAIAPVLAVMAEAGYQSEQRFAESFVRSRIQRGQGPQRIRSELKVRGIGAELAAEAIAAAEVDWFELARELYLRRFPNTDISDPRERAKRMRFLAYRGFDSEQVRYAMQGE